MQNFWAKSDAAERQVEWDSSDAGGLSVAEKQEHERNDRCRCTKEKEATGGEKTNSAETISTRNNKQGPPWCSRTFAKPHTRQGGVQEPPIRTPPAPSRLLPK